MTCKHCKFWHNQNIKNEISFMSGEKEIGACVELSKVFRKNMTFETIKGIMHVYSELKEGYIHYTPEDFYCNLFKEK